MFQSAMRKQFILPILATLAFTLSPAFSAEEAKPITLDELNAAQTEWCDGLIAISTANQKGEDAKAVAIKMLDELYNFENGDVLFKPTLTHGDQTFRPTKDAALAYFVGGNSDFPSDTGFALKPFKSARHQIKHFFTKGDVAIAMGNVWITDTDGKEIMVDKTFGYVRDGDKLKIVAHHSSLPFKP